MKPLLLALVPLLLIAQLSGRSQTPNPSPTPDQDAVVEGNNAFAIDLYAKLRAEDGNLFFSPDSISIALAMACAGARGETAAQMEKTLHFTLPPDKLHPAMGALLTGLNATHSGYQLHVADALWAEKDFSFLPDFLKRMSTDYGAGFNPVDFKAAPEAVRSTINQWVMQKTEGKIENLIPAGALTSSTRLVLTNAIYFKGNWATQFDKLQTRPDDFHLTPEKTVKAPLMSRSGGFNYLNGGSFQALEIPYKTSELSMIVFLPNDVGGLAEFEKQMTAASAQQWLGELKPAPKVVLTLPKFKMTRQFELAGTLGAMGMPLAFKRGGADFSGMTGKQDLWISAVIHKAFVDVNEEGTEAAAATGVTIRSAMARMPDRSLPIIFRVDHPFLFVIRDNPSGGILFMGRVSDPTK